MTQEVMIQIFESDFNKDGLVQTVNARDLHEALEIGWDFSTWIERQLGDFKENQDFIIFHKKVEKSKGRPMKDYALTLDTAKHICMMARCEKGRQLRQYFIEVEKQYRLGYAAAPQQQTELIPGTPEHFNKCFTECFTQAYSTYFGKPAQTALTDQQQHTEPVELAEDKTLPPDYTYKHHPDNEICLSEMEPYISNLNLRKELIAIFEFRGREHKPGSRKDKGNIFKAKPYTVYKKADVLPILKAAQRWKLNNGGEKLLGRDFSFKEEIAATDYQGEKFDEAYARLQDLNDKYLKEKQDKKRAKKQAK